MPGGGKAINLKRSFLLLLVATLAASLLFLSWPRLQSSLAFLPVETALDKHWHGEPIPEARFPDLIESATRSVQLHDEVRYWEGLSWLYYLQALLQGTTSGEGQASLRLAEQATTAVVQRAPAKPSYWLRLAWIHSLLREPAKKVTDNLVMSILSGRVETNLYSSRLVLGLHYLDHLDPEGQRLLRDQAILAWKYRWRTVVEFLLADAAAFSRMRQLLEETNPEIVQEMEKRLDGAR